MAAVSLADRCRDQCPYRLSQCWLGQRGGLLVMSIDDGLDHADLDPAHDALVLMINATDSTLTHSIPTATGFALHPVLPIH